MVLMQAPDLYHDGWSGSLFQGVIDGGNLFSPILQLIGKPQQHGEEMNMELTTAELPGMIGYQDTVETTLIRAALVSMRLPFCRPIYCQCYSGTGHNGHGR